MFYRSGLCLVSSAGHRECDDEQAFLRTVVYLHFFLIYIIGKKDFFVPNLFAKISKKRVITKKWRFFYRSMRKKDVIAVRYASTPGISPFLHYEKRRVMSGMVMMLPTVVMNVISVMSEGLRPYFRQNIVPKLATGIAMTTVLMSLT